MKVAVNARLLWDPSLRGWNRYTVNLFSELSAMGHRLVLCADRPIHESHLARFNRESTCVRISPAMSYFFWEQRWLPRQCAADGAEILHTPFHFGLPFFSPCPRVITLYDGIKELYDARQLSLQEKLGAGYLKSNFYNWVARASAEHVITISQCSKADLIRLGIGEDKITVVYPAAAPQFHDPVLESQRRLGRRQYGLEKPFVLYIGGWERRKNIPFLLEAFAEAKLEGVDLVLAGGSDQEQARVAPLVKSLGVEKQTRLLGRLEDPVMPALYSEALGFVYPSEYEGFGLQLCEAMATACPILAARAGSLPEVLGDGGDTFSLDSPRELSGLLRRLATDGRYRAELIERSKKRSVRYNWRQAAEETLTIYRQVVDQSKRANAR